MEFKSSFLSRLFGMKPEEQETSEEEDELLDLPSEDAPPEKPELHKLDLPREHSLFKLRSIYNEQFGWLPLPDLTLEGPGESPLPEAQAQGELLRLRCWSTPRQTSVLSCCALNTRKRRRARCPIWTHR